MGPFQWTAAENVVWPRFETPGQGNGIDLEHKDFVEVVDEEMAISRAAAEEGYRVVLSGQDCPHALQGTDPVLVASFYGVFFAFVH